MHLGYDPVAAILLWLQNIGHCCRKQVLRLRVDSTLVLRNVDMVLGHRCRADTTVEPVLERLRQRLHLEGVETSRLRRVQSHGLRVHDAGCPRVWRSPHHIACPDPSCHLVSLQLRTPRSLLLVLSNAPFIPILFTARFADLSTMARQGSDDWDLSPWAFFQIKFDGLRL